MNDPDLQKWLLAPDGIATRLRALRGTATGKDFAAAAGMRASKLSKLELAQQEPTADDIRAIVAAAGAPAKTAQQLLEKLGTRPDPRIHARLNRFGQTATQRRLNQILTETNRLRLYEPTHLPRPLMTGSYARAMLSTAATVNGGKFEDTAVRVIEEANKPVIDGSITLEVVLAESALRWQVLPQEEMRAQLRRIIDAAAWRHVDLRILPLDVDIPMLPGAGFALTDSGGYTDTLEGATELTGGRLKGHSVLMADLAGAAVKGQAAIDLVNSALARTWNAAPVRFDAGHHA